MSSVKDCVNKYTTHTLNDIDTLYDNIYNRLRADNMFLHPYQDINPTDGVELLNSSNCINYDNARSTISENVYLFFNTFKTKKIS